MAPFFFALLALSNAITFTFAYQHHLNIIAGVAFLTIIASITRLRYWLKHRDTLVPDDEVEQRIFVFRGIGLLIAGVQGMMLYSLLGHIPQSQLIFVTTMSALLTTLAAFAIYNDRWLPAANLLVMLTPSVLFMLSSTAQINHYLGLIMLVILTTNVLMLHALRSLIGAHFQRARREQRRAKSERLSLEALLSLSQQFYLKVDADRRMSDLSEGLCELIGLPRAELVGRPLSKLVNRTAPLGPERGFAAINRAMDAHGPFIDIETLLTDENGESYTVLWSGMPLYDVDTGVVGYRLWIDDVTEKRKQAENIRTSEARFKDFATLAAECLWETDADHRLTVIIGHIEEWTGVSNEELIGQRPFTLKEPAAGGSFTEGHKALIDAVCRRKDFRNLHVPSRTGLLIEMSGVARFDADGEFLGYRGYSKNVSAEQNALCEAVAAKSALEQTNKRLEDIVEVRTAALKNSNRLMSTVLSGLDEGLIVLSSDGNIEMLNERASSSLPIDADWKEGENYFWNYAELFTGRTNCGLHDVNGDPICFDIDHIFNGSLAQFDRRCASGQWIRERIISLTDGRWVVLLQDRTSDIEQQRALRALTNDLRSAKEQAEAADEMKSSYLASMTHEIRTPMIGVIGLADELKSSNLSTAQAEKVDVIHRCGNNLVELINDMLDLSKLEADKVNLRDFPFSLQTTLEDVGVLLASKANEKNISLTIESDHQIPEVRGDEGRIRQIMTNLIGNALKFTSEGGVTVNAAQSSTPKAGFVTLTINVTDTGCGVPQDKLDLIFDSYEQIDEAQTSTQSGTGLGLCISRNLAELMGGTLTATSTLGTGSTFTLTVTLPLADAVDPSAMDTQAVPEVNRVLRILAAEDNEVNRMVLSTLLKSSGHTLLFAENGQEAVTLCTEEEIDVVLMDVNMPTLDGKAATRALREKGQTLPIIGLTAHGGEAEKASCLQVGMDDVLTKPIDQSSLLRALAAAVGPTDTEDTNSGAQRAKA